MYLHGCGAFLLLTISNCIKDWFGGNLPFWCCHLACLSSFLENCFQPALDGEVKRVHLKSLESISPFLKGSQLSLAMKCLQYITDEASFRSRINIMRCQSRVAEWAKGSWKRQLVFDDFLLWRKLPYSRESSVVFSGVGEKQAWDFTLSTSSASRLSGWWGEEELVTKCLNI